MKTLAIFWYLIGGCYTRESQIINVEKILVLGKFTVSGSKSWAKDKKSVVKKKWFLVLPLSTR